MDGFILRRRQSYWTIHLPDDPPTGRSTGGFVFVVGVEAVSWTSRRQPIVTLSTAEAEYVALTDAAKEAIWLSGLLESLGVDCRPVVIWCDNTGAISLSSQTQAHGRTEHINVLGFTFASVRRKDASLYRTFLVTIKEPTSCRRQSQSMPTSLEHEM